MIRMVFYVQKHSSLQSTKPDNRASMPHKLLKVSGRKSMKLVNFSKKVKNISCINIKQCGMLVITEYTKQKKKTIFVEKSNKAVKKLAGASI